jgi:hypothetical protein
MSRKQSLAEAARLAQEQVLLQQQFAAQKAQMQTRQNIYAAGLGLQGMMGAFGASASPSGSIFDALNTPTPQTAAPPKAKPKPEYPGPVVPPKEPERGWFLADFILFGALAIVVVLAWRMF